MTQATITWPKKSRDIHNHQMNSTVWGHFRMRDDNAVLATYAKSGTKWMQQIPAPAMPSVARRRLSLSGLTKDMQVWQRCKSIPTG